MNVDKHTYTICSLPKTVQPLGINGKFSVDKSLQFQMEWEWKLSQLWMELSTTERKHLTPPRPGYTEAVVTDFISRLKQTKKQRNRLNTLVSKLPNWTLEKEFPVIHTRERKLIQQLRTGEHPFFLMQEIPAGDCMIGALKDDIEAYDFEKPQHKVTLNRSFAIGIYPVTQKVWGTVLGNNPSVLKDPDLPVEKVSWLNCILFCNILSEKEGLEKVYRFPQEVEKELQQNITIERSSNIQYHTMIIEKISQNLDANGYRLPTESEWERAARGNTPHLYSGSNDIDEVAWYTGNCEERMHPVGQKKANEFGLFDMSGNIYEWCWDWYGAYSETAKQDPVGASLGHKRVLRGGSWGDVANIIRCSLRYEGIPCFGGISQGLRLVRTLPTSPPSTPLAQRNQ